jgi:polyphosphate glucokinase
MQSNELNSAAGASRAIGVDVGGSSIKCALVDLATGEFVGERLSVPTPAHGFPRDAARCDCIRGSTGTG